MDNLKTILYPVEIIPLLHSVLETAGVGLFGTRRGQDGRTDGAFARCDFGRDIFRLRRAESSSSFSHKMDFILSRRAEGYKRAKWCQTAPEIRKGTASGHGINVKAFIEWSRFVADVAGKMT